MPCALQFQDTSFGGDSFGGDPKLELSSPKRSFSLGSLVSRSPSSKVLVKRHDVLQARGSDVVELPGDVEGRGDEGRGVGSDAGILRERKNNAGDNKEEDIIGSGYPQSLVLAASTVVQEIVSIVTDITDADSSSGNARAPREHTEEVSHSSVTRIASPSNSHAASSAMHQVVMRVCAQIASSLPDGVPRTNAHKISRTETPGERPETGSPHKELKRVSPGIESKLDQPQRNGKSAHSPRSEKRYSLPLACAVNASASFELASLHKQRREIFASRKEIFCFGVDRACASSRLLRARLI